VRRPAPADLVVLLRGAADRPQELLGNRTPLEYADLPHLRALSRRGRPRPFDSAPSGHSVHEGGDLAAAFGLTPSPDADLPAGALAALAAGEEAPSGPCLRADPASITVTPDAAVVRDPGQLALSSEEAAALAETLNQELFAEDGARLEVLEPGQWLLHLPEPPAIRTAPLEAWIGADARGGLATGPEGAAWHRLSNEVQMVLAGHPVNQRRREAGQLEVNTLWFWGGGTLPTGSAPAWGMAWGRAPLLAGLARFAGIPHRSDAGDFTEVMASAREGGPVLAVADAPRVAGARGDLGAKVDALEALDRDWLGPLEEALAGGRLKGAGVVLGPEAPTGARPDHPVPPAPVLPCRGGRVWPWQRPQAVSERMLKGGSLGWGDFPTRRPR